MRRTRRGNVVIMIALAMVVLLGFGALTIDMAYGRLVQQELQDAADASALGASAQLDGTSAGMTSARNMAVSLSAANRAAGAPVSLSANTSNASSGDVVLGNFDPDSGTFTPTTTAANVDAVQVRARIPTLGLFLAPIALGRDSVAVGATTTSYIVSGGAEAADCFLPIGLASCMVSKYGTSGLQNVTLKFQPAGIDNVGYARPGASPSASWTRDQLTNCRGSGEVEIGDSLGLQNGQATTDLTAFVTAVEASSTRWDTAKWGALPTQNTSSSIAKAKWGRTFESVVPVFDGGSSYCTGTGGAFTGNAPIAGFVWGAVYEVINKGAAKDRTIKMRLDFTREYNVGTQAGGPNWGIVAEEPPRIVPG
jgi:Flp pilus assembly protein TadG